MLLDDEAYPVAAHSSVGKIHRIVAQGHFGLQMQLGS